MPILKIAKIGHPILYQKALPIDKFDKNELKQLVANMCETMLDANGVGLAAPQVHVNKKLIIFRTPDVIEDESENQNKEEKFELNVLINPSYTNNSDDFEEGADEIRLNVYSENKSAISLYQKLKYNHKIITFSKSLSTDLNTD